MGALNLWDKNKEMGRTNKPDLRSFGANDRGGQYFMLNEKYKKSNVKTKNRSFIQRGYYSHGHPPGCCKRRQ